MKRGNGARVLDGVRMIDEETANFGTSIVVKGWYVERESETARACFILNKDSLQQKRGGSRVAVISTKYDKISCLTPPGDIL